MWLLGIAYLYKTTVTRFCYTTWQNEIKFIVFKTWVCLYYIYTLPRVFPYQKNAAMKEMKCNFKNWNEIVIYKRLYESLHVWQWTYKIMNVKLITEYAKNMKHNFILFIIWWCFHKIRHIFNTSKKNYWYVFISWSRIIVVFITH